MICLEIRDAQYVLAVVKLESFSQAAQFLGITQPALSQAIQKIERGLGFSLFDRSGRTVKPTRAATTMIPEIESLLRQSTELTTLQESLASEGGSIVQSPVRIGSVPSVLLGLLPQVMPFLFGVNPLIYEMDSASQLRAIDRNEIDVGFVRDWPTRDGRVQLLGREPLVLALPDTHPLYSRESVSLTELADERFVFFPREAAPAAFDSATAACIAAGFSMKVRHYGTNDQAVLGMVACGLGISLLPQMLMRVIWPGVRLLPLVEDNVNVPLGVAYRFDDPQGHGQMFFSAAAEVLRN